MMPYEQALVMILALARRPAVEEVPLLEAGGRHLAEGVAAPWELPRFDNSSMDGFAVRSADTAGGAMPARLRIVGESAAGRPFAGVAGPGEAVRISTGAGMPAGCDAVIPVEQARVSGDGASVEFDAAAQPGAFVRRRGSDVAGGAMLLGAGARVGPGVLSALAAFNVPTVKVYRRPRVAILTSGDEILPHGRTPTGTQIIGSSVYHLEHAVGAMGCEARLMGIARDDADDFERLMRAALEWGDIVLTTAGVSVGEHDVVGRVVARLGGRVHLWKVAVRPGKPMLVATFGDKVHFGFPGNPVSTACNAEIFLRPFLRRCLGAEPAVAPRVRARLGAPCPRDRQRLFFVYTEVRVEEGALVAWPLANQNSGNLLLPALANALAVVEPGEGPVPAGGMVEVIVYTPLPGMG